MPAMSDLFRSFELPADPKEAAVYECRIARAHLAMCRRREDESEERYDGTIGAWKHHLFVRRQVKAAQAKMAEARKRVAAQGLVVC